MRVTYVGPHDEVVMPSLRDLTCKRGESIEVDDDLGHELVQQEAWETAKAGKQSTTNTKDVEGSDK